MKAGITEYVPKYEFKEYFDALRYIRKVYGLPPAPAMPCISHAVIAKNGRPLAEVRPHQDHQALPGTATVEWWSLVHTPIPLKIAWEIKGANDALDAEFLKLRDKPAWGKIPRSKAEVKADGIKTGKTVHFGSLMQLCHLKHAEFDSKYQT